MLKTRICPQCGAPLPAEGWAGLCPQCLVRVSLEPSATNAECGVRSAESRAGAPEKTVVAQAADILTEQTGTMIGRYKLLQEIGEGGFGMVYMAEQTEPVQRKVALKIIKAGMDTREIIARFEA